MVQVDGLGGFSNRRAIAMIIRWAVTDIGHEQVINGDFVTYADYQSLQEALRESLDSWEASRENVMPGFKKKRIAALRTQFLDHK